jgi:hypothetical protein
MLASNADNRLVPLPPLTHCSGSAFVPVVEETTGKLRDMPNLALSFLGSHPHHSNPFYKFGPTGADWRQGESSAMISAKLLSVVEIRVGQGALA